MTMPDQFVLSAFNQRELARPDRPPLMAEIALVSSHIPWVPIPRVRAVERMSATAPSSQRRARPRMPMRSGATRRASRQFYWPLGGIRVAASRPSFITTYGRDNTLVILLGDHQPMDFIAGDAANHDVPIHIIARDPDVLRALASPDWSQGMTPPADANAASLRMDSVARADHRTLSPPALSAAR